jgi:hypothetical protein
MVISMKFARPTIIRTTKQIPSNVSAVLIGDFSIVDEKQRAGSCSDY